MIRKIRSQQLGRELFADGLVGLVLDFVQETWKGIQLPHGIRLEKRITLLFMKELNRCCHEDTAYDWAFFPEVPDCNAEGKEVSRIDIGVSAPGRRQPEYCFVFEGKRLNISRGGRTISNAAEYVGPAGMMCFVTGKYSSGQSEGGMLGYVMDGELNPARSAIVDRINLKRTELRLAPGTAYSPSKQMPKAPFNGETKHSLEKARKFTIFHLLLPIQRN